MKEKMNEMLKNGKITINILYNQKINYVYVHVITINLLFFLISFLNSELPKNSTLNMNPKRRRLEVGLPIGDTEPETEKEVIVENGKF